MKLTGERQIPADRTQVWAKLNDVDVLKRCIPGCQSLEQVSPTELKATVAVKIGPMNAKFTGDVELKDLNPPESYRIEGAGSGGVAGRASGGADVRLEDVDDATRLIYDVDAKISGKIAQLGQRLIDATAKSLAEKFFDSFAAEFAPDDAEASALPTDELGRPASGETEPAGAIGRSRPQPTVGRSKPQGGWLWYGVGAIALALLVLLIVQSFTS